jgi:undecaprenyl-diphosphatase
MTHAEMTVPPTPAGSSIADRSGGLLVRAAHELLAIDTALYDAVRRVSTPTLDAPMRILSNAANRSQLWLAAAGALALVGGPAGRRSAVRGLVAIAAASAVVNLGLKAVHARPRPLRDDPSEVIARHVPMPLSSSFPSGHSASGFAFSSAVACGLPLVGYPLQLVAAAVAYSRVHTGVHYPGDAVAGALVGSALGQLACRTFDQHRSRRTPQRTRAARPAAGLAAHSRRMQLGRAAREAARAIDGLPLSSQPGSAADPRTQLTRSG